jgi:hypothetical protein
MTKVLVINNIKRNGTLLQQVAFKVWTKSLLVLHLPLLQVFPL